MKHAAIASTISLALAVAGCSGAGRTSSPLPAASMARASFVIHVPAKVAPQTSNRRPAYVSPSTQSVTIAIDGATPQVTNLTPTSPGCTSTSGALACTVTFSVSVGTHTFTVTTYDALNGAGNVLSKNSLANQAVLATGSNTFSIVLGGVVAKVTLALASTTPSVGASVTIPLTVTALDADGNTIVGAQAFANGPIVISDSDTSGATTLSTSTVVSPATAVTVTYNGSSSVTSATFSVSSPALPSADIVPVVLRPLAIAISGSNALGIYTAPNGTTYAFVPNGAGLASVTISNGSTLALIRKPAAKPNATSTAAPLVPLQIPLTPAPNACTPDSADALLYCFSFFSATVNVLDLSQLPTAITVKATYVTDATVGVNDSSGGCMICGAVYDAVDNAVVYATGNGYELYSSALAATPNTHTLTVAANVSENFGYDATTDTIFSPEYDGYPAQSQSIDLLPLKNDTLFSLSPAPAGLNEPDAGAVDASSGIGVSTEEVTAGSTNTAYLINLSAPMLNSPASAMFTAPEATTGLSSSLFGFNISTQCAVPVTNIAVDSNAHLAFFSAEFCGQQSTDQYQSSNGAVTPVGVATLPASATSPLQFGNSIFANLPPLPDGTLWDDALDPHAIAAFDLPGVCADCGAIFNLEDTWIAVINLPKLLAAPPSATDMHTVDPSYDLIGNGVVTYIPTGYVSSTAAALARRHLVGHRRP